MTDRRTGLEVEMLTHLKIFFTKIIAGQVCSVIPVAGVEQCGESEYYSPSTGTELPYCTICLERMDESVSTVMTILCNHKFHSSCLAQWEDPTCPVCRYVQTPEMAHDQVEKINL